MYDGCAIPFTSTIYDTQHHNSTILSTVHSLLLDARRTLKINSFIRQLPYITYILNYYSIKNRLLIINYLLGTAKTSFLCRVVNIFHLNRFFQVLLEIGFEETSRAKSKHLQRPKLDTSDEL